jgi:hypothetical protein
MRAEVIDFSGAACVRTNFSFSFVYSGFLPILCTWHHRIVFSRLGQLPFMHHTHRCLSPVYTWSSKKKIKLVYTHRRPSIHLHMHAHLYIRLAELKKKNFSSAFEPLWIRCLFLVWNLYKATCCSWWIKKKKNPARSTVYIKCYGATTNGREEMTSLSSCLIAIASAGQ